MYKTVVEKNSYMSIGITLRNFTYKTSGKGYKVIRIRTRYQESKNCLKTNSIQNIKYLKHTAL